MNLRMMFQIPGDILGADLAEYSRPQGIVKIGDEPLLWGEGMDQSG